MISSPEKASAFEVLEGQRPTLIIPVSGVAESLLGSPAYMRMQTLTRLLGEPGRISAVYLRIDKNRASSIFKALKSRPYVAGVSMKSDARAAFQKMMDTGAGSMRYIMLIIAGIITFGIVYNAARIAFAERQRDLASLRVMGFTRPEVSFVLLGELAHHHIGRTAHRLHSGLLFHHRDCQGLQHGSLPDPDPVHSGKLWPGIACGAGRGGLFRLDRATRHRPRRSCCGPENQGMNGYR